MKQSFPNQSLAKLKHLLANQRHDLDWHYDFGELVDRLVPESTYGASEMKQLADKLERPEHYELVLYQHRDFVRAYKRSELPKLNDLSFAHVCILQGIKNESQREKFRRWTLAPLAKNKSVRSVRLLRAKVQEANGKKGSNGGRPVHTVLDIGPQTALREIVQLGRRWQEQYVGPFEKHVDRLAELLRNKATDDLIELAIEARATLRNMLQQSKQMERKLNELMRTAKSRELRKVRQRPVHTG